jgi:glucose-6-phosphate 1-dehydrogenase
VQIAMAEAFGVEVGAVRDEKVKVFRAIRPLTGRSLARGQYRSYCAEAGVATDSRVETFAAMQIHLDSRRWQGVPFFLRAGKQMPVTATEVVVGLRRPPQQVFPETIPPRSNSLRFRLGPRQGAIALGALVKRHGADNVGDEIELQVCNTQDNEIEASKRLIGDAFRGDATLFAPEDSVEAAWRIVAPILGKKTPLHDYEPGTWGLAEASAMIGEAGGWLNPQAAG